jgi:serine/threonine protein phosphatase PrpC
MEEILKEFFMEHQSEIETAEYFLPFQTLDPDRIEQPLSSRTQIDFGAVSDVGKVRTNNEDAYLIFRTGRFWEKIQSSLEDQLLPPRHEQNAYTMAVADGMGGLAAGEVASRTAIITVVNLMLSSVKWALTFDHPELREQEIQEGIDRAVSYLCKADQAISQRAKAEGAYQGMGTTLTAAYSFADDLFIFHVGDSRAYLFRDGELFQITRDHTVAQSLADAGAIPQSAVEKHHFKHVLTQAVGVHEGKMKVEIHQLKLIDGDQLLLCTDGLHDFVKAEEIAKALNDDRNSQQKCKGLLDLALNYGGKDNVTVLIGKYRLP